jgi:putative copper resistance protein D
VPDILSVALRALGFVLVFQAAGVVIFIALFGHRLDRSQVAIRRLGQAAAIAGMVLVAGHYALEAARMAGQMSGVWDPTLQSMMWHSPNRAALLCRLLGLLLIAVGLHGATQHRTIVAIGGVVLATGAFTLVGHTSVNTHRAVLATLLMIHVLIVAFWFGALGPLYLVSLKEPPARAFDVTQRFTAVATWLVPVILLAGVTMAALLLPDAAALRAPYGRLLIAKFIGFVLLMGLAAANRWRLAPGLADATNQSERRFRRSLAAEYVLIAAVLTITAIMTSLFSPDA